MLKNLHQELKKIISSFYVDIWIENNYYRIKIIWYDKKTDNELFKIIYTFDGDEYYIEEYIYKQKQNTLKQTKSQLKKIKNLFAEL